MCVSDVMHCICLQLFYLLIQKVLVNHSAYVKEGVSHSEKCVCAEEERKDKKQLVSHQQNCKWKQCVLLAIES